ncbi:hypothetical protein [Segatella oris]|uniref:hypothetical protein n=1 Tax=Segatella oris TaxID=28135 RepID=UPI0028EC0124|nr:hypothetical protein [Segatella oris]
MSEITVPPVQAHARNDPHEGGFRFLPCIHGEGLSNPFCTVLEVVGISVSPCLKVKKQLETVVIVDGLMKF